MGIVPLSTDGDQRDDNPAVGASPDERQERACAARARAAAIDERRRATRRIDPDRYPRAASYSWRPVCCQLARDGWDRDYLAHRFRPAEGRRAA